MRIGGEGVEAEKRVRFVQEEEEEERDAQRQYVVIGTLAPIL